jgi:hypothetical protein
MLENRAAARQRACAKWKYLRRCLEATGSGQAPAECETEHRNAERSQSAECRRDMLGRHLFPQKRAPDTTDWRQAASSPHAEHTVGRLTLNAGQSPNKHDRLERQRTTGLKRSFKEGQVGGMMSPVGGVRSSSPAPNRVLEMIPGSSESTLVTIDHACPTCGQSVETVTPGLQTPVPPTMLEALSSSTSCSDTSHQHKLCSRTTMTMHKCRLT